MPEQGERTEQATPRRRQKAREKGQVARSRELTAMASLGGILLVLYFTGGKFMDGLTELTGRLLSLQYGTDPFYVFRTASLKAVYLLIPLFAAAVVMSIGTAVAQGGFVFKPFELSLSALNPIEGIKKKFSLQALGEFFKSLLKFLIGGYLFYYVVKKNIFLLPFLMDMSISDIKDVSSRLIMEAVAYGFALFFVIAIISYILERQRFERSIRMTKEEVKEEYKETEGDPRVKSRIRSIQYEMARRRMMQEVPKATVVVTNPVHLAIALKYEDKKMPAPKVVAKGAGVIAEKIKDIAKKHGVPVVEDKPLARMLYKVELDSYIPQELYRAVAKIIAYIYKLRGAA
jgi:flagellar biosynthetic protein FlhB